MSDFIAFQAKDSQSRIALIYITDTSDAPLTGLTFSSAGLAAAFKKNLDTVVTSITLVAGTLGTYTSGGFIEVDSVLMPGVYELSLPDFAFQSNVLAQQVMIWIGGAATMKPLTINYEITGVDPTDQNGFGLNLLYDMWYGSGPFQGLSTFVNAAVLIHGQNINNFSFLMLDSNDHITPKTGLTVQCQVSNDGGPFVDCLATPASEVANGIYNTFLDGASDLYGHCVVLKFTASGADPRFITLLLA